MNPTLSSHSRLSGIRVLIALFIGAGTALFSDPTPAGAASISVTTTSDEIINNGRCSLREAIQAANRDQAIGGCAAGSGADTITLSQGIYMLSIPGQNEDAAGTGDLDLTSQVTIRGAGIDTTIIDGAHLDRVLDIRPGANLQLASLTLRNGGSTGFHYYGGGIFNSGMVTLSGSAVRDSASDWGGAIFNQGTLTLRDSALTGSEADYGGGIYNLENGRSTLTNSTVTDNRAHASGGGVYIRSLSPTTLSTVDMNNVVIARNSAGWVGGGLENENAGGPYSEIRLNTVTITENSASRDGGGISNSGSISINQSTISRNHAAWNGAGIVSSGNLLIENTSISDNQINDGGGSGGGIWNKQGSLILRGSIVSGNRTSNAKGGGVLHDAGTMTVENSLFRDNASETGGGAIASNARLDINDSQFTSNYGFSGGGAIYNAGALTIARSRFDDNTGSDGVQAAGAIYNIATATLADSTISRNRSYEWVGGIINEGTFSVNNSTISGNEGGGIGGIENRSTLMVSSTTISGNLDLMGFGADLLNQPDSQFTIRNTIAGKCKGNLTSDGYNLIQTTPDCTITGNTTGNLLNVDPRLGPLQDNGGPTYTHLPLPGSPAIDAASPAAPGGSAGACPVTDQRGIARPQDGNADGSARCDIGAVEVQGRLVGRGLTGAYYDNLDFTALKRTRIDPAINFDWGYGTPDASMEDSTFAVRWSGQLLPRSSERYTFFTQNDDGVRLWVNNQLIIDDWRDHGLTEQQGSLVLQAGVPVSIRLDYYENHGQSAIKLLWSSPSQPKQIIPATQFLPAPGLIGAYYDNQDFTNLKLTRQDTTVNFDWSYGAPDASMEDSTFAVRWSGQLLPRSSERYTFFTQNDDGVRLWVNNQLIIDDWRDHGLTEQQGSLALQAGVPVSIRLDYYENHGQSAIKLLWSSPSQPKQIIPATQLLPPQ